MNTATFISYLKEYLKGIQFLRNMYDAGLDLYESPLCNSADFIFQAWLEQLTNEEGQDLIYWWIFEDVDKIITEDENDINVEDIEDFAKYLKAHGYI